MSYLIRAILATGLLVLLPIPVATAGDTRDQPTAKRGLSHVRSEPPEAKAKASSAKADQEIPEIDLLEAAREGLVSVQPRAVVTVA